MKLNIAALAILAGASAVLAVPTPEADNHKSWHKEVDDYDYGKHHDSGKYGKYWRGDGNDNDGHKWYYDGSRWYYFDKWGKKVYGNYSGHYKRDAAPEAEALAEASAEPTKHHHKDHGVFWHGHEWFYDGRYFYWKGGRKFYGKYHGPKFHKGWKREAAPEPEALAEAEPEAAPEALAEASAEPTKHHHKDHGVFWHGHEWFFDGRYFYWKGGRKFYGKYHGPKFHKGWKREAAPEPEALAEAEPEAAPEALAEASAEPTKHHHKQHGVFWHGHEWFFDGRYFYWKGGRKFYGKYHGPKFGRH